MIALNSALGVALIFGSQSPVLAKEADSAPAQSGTQSAIPGWDKFLDGLRDLPRQMTEMLPPELRGNPQVQQELGRLAIEALAARSISAISADPDRPAFLPHINETLNIFQPNSDTIYRVAQVAPSGTYRLRGKRGTLRIARIAQMSDSPDNGAAIRPPVYNDLNTLKVDAEDRYDVIISPTRPENYTGDWWQLAPGTVSLMLRQVSSDWAKEVDPTLSIERLDVPAPRPRPSAADLQTRLENLAHSTSSTAKFLLAIPAKLRADGYINKMQVFDVGTSLGGLTGQFYYHGAYEIAQDEALVLEAKVPSQCLYYSTILTNDIFETTDWVNNQSSLNDAQSIVDPDGVLRIVISAGDPGVPNWLDTAGYLRGVVQGRWTECNAQPLPTLKKVKLSEVRKHLHPKTGTITLAERDRILRDRRAAFQQRIRW